jgi:hypothetical protein
MSPKMLEDAFKGAKIMYDDGDISKDEYLNILKGFDTEKIIASSSEDFQKKQQLNQLISSTINILSTVA